jgi:hypothetical protein
VPIRLPKAPVPDRPSLTWKILAAAAMIVAVGSSVRLALMQPPPPQGGAVVVFDDSDQTRSGEESGEEEELPRMSSSQTGVFSFYLGESYTSYRGEISEDGKVVWKTDFKVQPMDRKISFMAPAGSLKAGRYEARLFGIADGRRYAAGRLSFEVDGP